MLNPFEDDQDMMTPSVLESRSTHRAIRDNSTGSDGKDSPRGTVPLVQLQDVQLEEERERITKEKLAFRKRIFSRIKYYLPILTWLPQYKRSYFLSDLVAGITVGVLIIPQALAYATLCNLPPITGLQTSFFPIIFYTFLGTSGQLAVGPEAIISILTGIALESYAPNNADKLSVYPILTFLVGLFTLTLGIFRFGFLADILSFPMLNGFLNAVAIEIILEQSDKFFGMKVHEHSWHKFPEIFADIEHANWIAFGVGIGAILFLVFLKFVKRRLNKNKYGRLLFYIPDSLVVVTVAIIISKQLDFEGRGVPVLGKVDATLLAPAMPNINLDQIADMASNALFLSIIGIVESSIIARGFAAKHNYRISTNRELVALGSANLFSSIFRTFPAMGSLPRSVVNDSAGALTPLAGLFTSMVVLLAIFVFMPFFSYLPVVVMGAIVVMAAVGLFELHEIHFLWSIRSYPDLGLLALAFFSTLILDAEFGIVITIMVSVFLIAKLTSRPYLAVLKQSSLTDKDQFEESVIIRDYSIFDDKHFWFTHSSTEKGILICKILEDSLHFANIRRFHELFMKLEHMGHSPLDGIIVDAVNILNIDATSIIKMKEMVRDWNVRNILFCFVHLRSSHMTMFEKSGLVELMGRDRFFDSIGAAVDYVSAHRPKIVEHMPRVDSATSDEFVFEERSHTPVNIE